MSDTATQETKAKERKVQYVLDIVDELPARRSGGGGGNRTSIFTEKLDAIKGDSQYHNKWVLIARYGNATAATAAKNVLQQRLGRDQSVAGFAFATRPVPKAEQETGLFVQYDPSKIVEGALASHEKAEAKRKADIAAAKESGEGSGNGQKAAETQKQAARK